MSKEVKSSAPGHVTSQLSRWDWNPGLCNSGTQDHPEMAERESCPVHWLPLCHWPAPRPRLAAGPGGSGVGPLPRRVRRRVPQRQSGCPGATLVPGGPREEAACVTGAPSEGPSGTRPATPGERAPGGEAGHPAVGTSCPHAMPRTPLSCRRPWPWDIPSTSDGRKGVRSPPAQPPRGPAPGHQVGTRGDARGAPLVQRKEAHARLGRRALGQPAGASLHVRARSARSGNAAWLRGSNSPRADPTFHPGSASRCPHVLGNPSRL